MLLRHEPGIILSLLPTRDSNLLATQAFHVSLTLSTDLGHTMYPVSVGRQSHSLSSLGFPMSAYEDDSLTTTLAVLSPHYYYSQHCHEPFPNLYGCRLRDEHDPQQKQTRIPMGKSRPHRVVLGS